MKYAVKIDRNTKTGRITVHPIARVMDSTKPYDLKYPALYWAECLKIFSSKGAALHYIAEETVAAEYSQLATKDLIARSNVLFEKYAALGLTVAQACRMVGVSRFAVQSARRKKGIRPNPRSIAKLAIAFEKIAPVIKSLPSILPGFGVGKSIAGKRWGDRESPLNRRGDFSPPL